MTKFSFIGIKPSATKIKCRYIHSSTIAISENVKKQIIAAIIV